MIADALRRLPARRAVIILDTCQSGAAIEALAKVATVKESADMRRKTDSAGAVDLTPEVGVHLIAATMPLSYAIGAQSARSALAEALLSAVTATGQTTVSEVAEYLRPNLPDVSQRVTRGLRQVPQISAVGSDFVLAVR